MLAAALAARFLLEVVLLLVLAAWGFQLADSLALGVLTGLAAPAAGALIWGLFISPSRRVELGRIPRLVLELALFCVAAGALWRMHWPVAAILLIAAASANRFGLIWLRRRELARRYAGRSTSF
jgi:hypothetical protein